MRTDLLKTLFPDILSLEKNIKDPKSGNIRLLNNLLKILSEDNELLKKLAR
jgi:hypothetical protein